MNCGPRGCSRPAEGHPCLANLAQGTYKLDKAA
jgi:hypothetical protein